MSAPDLYARLAALEAKVSQLGASEAAQPNYLTVTPTGTVGANFTGHVHAQGLDLDAGTSTTPPSQDRIRWLQVSNGALIADISCYEIGGNGSDIQVTAYEQSVFETASAALVALGSDGSSQANFQATITNNVGKVSISPGGTLYDGASGGSVFVRNAKSSVEQLLLARGSATTAIGAGLNGVTVTLNATMPNVNAMVPVYAVTPANSGTITSTELHSFSATTVTVYVNSTVGQNVTVYALALGTP